jgi:hypothetical protein
MSLHHTAQQPAEFFFSPFLAFTLFFAWEKTFSFFHNKNPLPVFVLVKVLPFTHWLLINPDFYNYPEN